MQKEFTKEKLKQIIDSSLTCGILNAGKVRVLGVQKKDLSTQLIVFACYHWYEYIDFGDRFELGTISLSRWLDELDGKNPAHNAREYSDTVRQATAALKNTVHQAITELVRDHYSDAFARYPAFISEGLDDNPHAIVAWAHPRGWGEILRFSTRKEKTYSSDHPSGTLHAGGVTLFYPAGIGAGLGTKDKTKEQTTVVRDINFRELEIAFCLDDRHADDRKIVYRSRNDAQNHIIENDTVLDSLDSDVFSRLLQHFQNAEPAVFFDLASPPHPLDDAQRFKTWVHQYLLSGHEYPQKIAWKVHETFGLKAAEIFVDRIPASHQNYSRTRCALVAIYCEEKRWQQAWELSETVLGEGRVWLYAMVPRILIMLGRYRDAMAEAEKIACSDHLACRALSLAAVAASLCGDDADAMRRAGALAQSHPDKACSHYALACALQKSEPQNAILHYQTAMRLDGYDDTYCDHDFQNGPARLITLVQASRAQAGKSQARAGAFGNFRDFPMPWFSPNLAIAAFEAGHAWHRDGFIAGMDFCGYRRFIPLPQNDATHGDYIVLGDYRPAKLTRVSLETKSFHSRPIGSANDCTVVDACFHGGRLYTLENNGRVCIYASQDLEHAIAVMEPNSEQSASRIQVGAGLICVGHDNGVEIHDGGDYAHIDTVSSYRYEHGDLCRDICLMETSGRRVLVLALNYLGLLSVDVSDPGDHKILQQLKLSLPESDSSACASRILAWGGYLFVDNDHDATWVVDARDAANLKGMGILPVKHDGAVIFGMDGRAVLTADNRVWHLALREDSLSVDGVEEFEDSSEYGNFMLGDHFLFINEAIEDDDHEHDEDEEDDTAGAFIGVRTARNNNDIESLLQRYETACIPWMETGLQLAVDADNAIQAIGCLALSLDAYHVHLDVQAARSAVNLNHDLPDAMVYRHHASVDAWLNMNGASETLQDVPGAVFRRIADRVLENMASSAVLPSLAAARVHLLEDSGRTRFIKTLIFPGQDYAPFREHGEGETKLDIPALLTGANPDRYEESIIRALRDDPGLLKDLLPLVADGNIEAHFIAAEVAEIDESAVLKAFIRCAQAGYLSNPLVVFIRKHRDHPEVDSVLEQAMDHEDLYIMGPAAKGLDRLESDAVINRIRHYLTSTDMEALEDALDFIAIFEKRIGEFRQDLVDACDAHHSRTDCYAKITRQLRRAGQNVPPAALFDHAQPLKQYEMEDDGFSFSQYEPDELCTQLRHWLADLLVERVAAAKANGDRGAPLWFPEYPPEPKTENWRQFFTISWPKLNEARLCGFFMETLSAHTTDEYSNDHGMMVAAMETCLGDPDHVDLGVKLASAITRTPALSTRDVRHAEQVLGYGALKQAQAAMDNGDLAGARKTINTLLAEKPADFDSMLLDVVLVSRENGIEAGMEKLDAVMPKLSTHHQVGPQPSRARFFNLYGCFLDQLQCHEEAKPWFYRAAEADPDSVTYMNNLAEIHEKLGEMEAARTWAQKARDAGSTSTLVARILD